MRTCSACGHDVPDLAAACPRCWAAVAPDPNPEPAATLEEQARRSAELWVPGVGSIFHLALDVYRKNLRTLLRVIAPVVIPLHVVIAVIRGALPDQGDVVIGSPFVHPFAPPPVVDVFALMVFVAGKLVMVGLAFFAIQLAAAACIRAVGDVYRGDRPEWRGSLSFAVERRVPGLRVTAICTALICSGILLGVVPSLLLYVSWAVVMPVTLVERNAAGSALRRSAHLVRGRWWAVLRVVGTATLIVWACGVVVRSGFAWVASAVGDLAVVALVVDVFASAAAATLLTPFVAVTIVLLYFDLRLRKEGLSANELGRNLGRHGGRPKE